jgi:methionyl-tRNA formyltransferase
MQPLLFFGSDQYSAIVLAALLESRISHLTSIITDRPKPKDRDQVVEPNPVEKLALTHNLKVLYYPDKKEEMNTFVALLESDILRLTSKTDLVGLCASFDHLVPAGVIDLFHGNLFNLHPSLLPQYRNVSPVQYALALGDKETGITLFRITTGIDNGEIIAQVAEPIRPDDTTPTLSAHLFPLGADLFLEYLNTPGVKGAPHSGSVNPGAPLIFTHRLTRDSGYLEWPILLKLINNQAVAPTDTTNELLRLRLERTLLEGPILTDLLRALTPWPGVWTLASTKKGDLRISLISHTGNVIPDILIAGKPNPISWSDFVKYYL